MNIIKKSVTRTEALNAGKFYSKQSDNKSLQIEIEYAIKAYVGDKPTTKLLTDVAKRAWKISPSDFAFAKQYIADHCNARLVKGKQAYALAKKPEQKKAIRGKWFTAMNKANVVNAKKTAKRKAAGMDVAGDCTKLIKRIKRHIDSETVKDMGAAQLVYDRLILIQDEVIDLLTK